ncbi:MAG: hypothetical protein Q8N03_07495 [Ignavibacteria bacterium]|nr:hypothetical protein [Ignavibacteria bacterium]MDP3831125.1 hypothetical protein [Ignavibacteriaceae bacterium]
MKNSIFLVFLLFTVVTMCQESEIQLSIDENEAAAESHISINPLNGDKAVIYKVHNSSGSVFVEYKVVLTHINEEKQV